MKMRKEEAGKEGTQAGGETKSNLEQEDCKMSAKRRGKEEEGKKHWNLRDRAEEQDEEFGGGEEGEHGLGDPPHIRLSLERGCEVLQVEDGFPLRVVEGRWPEGDGEEGGDRGEDGDHLEDALPVVCGGELEEEEAGGCNLCNCNVSLSPSAQCSVFQLFRVELKMEIFPTERRQEDATCVIVMFL